MAFDLNAPAEKAVVVSVATSDRFMDAPATRDAISHQLATLAHNLEHGDPNNVFEEMRSPKGYKRAHLEYCASLLRLTFEGSLDQMEERIEARIEELGLDKDLVHASGVAHSTIEEHQAFLRLKFEDQMKRFR